MLPKFASHVFHHTQRAAQNSALRNVLGLQNQGTASASSSGPLANWSNAASGSSWGGAGGAKYNSGSRFYQGYTVRGLDFFFPRRSENKLTRHFFCSTWIRVLDVSSPRQARQQPRTALQAERTMTRTFLSHGRRSSSVPVRVPEVVVFT